MKIIQYLQKDFNLFELFKGSSIAFISKIISIGVGYVFFLLVSKFYNAAEVGIFSTMWTVLMIGAVIGKLGVDTSIVRFIAGDIAENEGNNITNSGSKDSNWFLWPALWLQASLIY